MGRHGQKTGSGFYKYDPETRKRISDSEVEALIIEEAGKMDIEQRKSAMMKFLPLFLSTYK
ncbi:MAG: hypothetical protein CM1200mP40_24330 [Gammaproteobacteria bacterium]|nr:MAG: hypothetical protein CM1200mP40_24330 [Gammaproteobacteria bacterium]